jgi:hypothetical protein
VEFFFIKVHHSLELMLMLMLMAFPVSRNHPKAFEGIHITPYQSIPPHASPTHDFGAN